MRYFYFSENRIAIFCIPHVLIPDFSLAYRFDETKGFFCQVDSHNRNKCLGRNKGRQYQLMDERAATFLQVGGILLLLIDVKNMYNISLCTL